MSTKVSSKITKEIKDVNKPKKASTAYIIFCNKMREQVKNDNPTMKSNEIMTELGRLWKNLSDSDKVTYNALYEKERERYTSEMSTYVPPPKQNETPSSSKTKKSTSSAVETKKDNSLKKPMNAYVIFSQEQRPSLSSENPKLGFGELTKQLAERWKNMSDSEKAPYVERSAEQKDNYKRLVSRTPQVKTESKTTFESKPKSVKKKHVLVIDDEEVLKDEE